MIPILLGQISLIICCIFYLVWWYRCYRPGVVVSRTRGKNGIMLFFTFLFGVAGACLSLWFVEEITRPKIDVWAIIIGGVLGYFIFLLITRYLFHRKVTSELFLITGWTMLEVSVNNKLNAGGLITDARFSVMCAVIAAASLISMVLYVAYYRMEEMKAFRAAMVPLVTETIAMGVLIVMMTG